MKIRVFIPLLVALAMLAGLFLLVRHQQQLLVSSVSALDSNRVRWNSAQIERILREADRAYTRAEAALQGGAYQQAQQIYREQIRRPLDPFIKHFPNHEVLAGQTLEGWFEDHEEIWRGDVRTAFENILEALPNGRVPVEDAEGFIEAYPEYPELRRLFDERREPIAAERLRQAPHWLRLRVTGADRIPGLRHAIDKRFSERWRPTARPLDLALGKALSPAEEKATRLVLTVEVHIDYATYKISRTSAFQKIDWTPPPVPGFVKLRFHMDNRAPFQTSWDRLAVREVLFRPPQLISRNTAPLLIEKYHAAIVRELNRKLDDLPVFQIQSRSGKKGTP